VNAPLEANTDETVSATPTLTCYALTDFAHRIVPAPVDRAWMNAFPDRHPYRCLPLAIANTYGWHVLCPAPIEIEWNGGKELADLKVRALKPLPQGRPVETFCQSNFSRGIATMQVDYLFQTSPGWDLWAGGPANSPKENAYPLTGIIETAWLPYPFTMNWQIMRPGKVIFEQDEPICSIYPVQKSALLACEPVIRRLSENPELAKQAAEFRTERNNFIARLKANDPEAHKQAWMKRYFSGELGDGTRAGGDHLTKLRLKEPVDRRESQYGKRASPYRISINNQ
jgi:hypothetical protein